MNLNQYKNSLSDFKSGLSVQNYNPPLNKLSPNDNNLKAQLLENPEEFHNILREFININKKELVPTNIDFNDFFIEIKKSNHIIEDISLEEDTIILKSSKKIDAETRMNLIDDTFLKLIEYNKNIGQASSSDFFVDFKIME